MPSSESENVPGELLPPGTLQERASRAYAHALDAGALKPIPAVRQTVMDGGIAFTVWQLARPNTRLPGDPSESGKPAYSETDANPFLPYDSDLYVSGLTRTHVCLLNKYNILDVHLLLVTRSFEHQEDWLTAADCEALCICMAEFDGLAFYNGGRTAGASQRHKHLQYVPLPLGGLGEALPISASIAAARWNRGIGIVPSLPFVHALGRLERKANESTEQAAERMHSLYWTLLAATGIQRGEGRQQTRAYNLLATREWMMIVPRSRESYAGVSVNALGFAGSLLVRNEAQLRRLREIGPLTVLQEVGETWDSVTPA